VDRWEQLLDAARTDADRVGPPGAGLVRGDDGGWWVEGELSREDAAWLLPLLPVAGSVGVVVHLAQSLDGRIALPDGRSQWISGDADLVHTHRLRALCDAVIVGARTVAADDPRLTVRRVSGPNPVRVVIDPAARLEPDRKVFADEEAETLRVCAEGQGQQDDEETVVLPAPGGRFDPAALVAALRERGIGRILVEGGGLTASQFVVSRVADRLHLVVAPVLLGAGCPSFDLPEPLAPSLDACPRPPMRWWPLGDDLLLDCDLRR
jgi:diaminohydroxyphosphoribosylaminopyrimidine deaminase / 5-amino-6-(5-phosphoribosylamino)uracil reductase